MALITCPECGRKISEKAPACPGCGILQADIQLMLQEIQVSQVTDEPAHQMKDADDPTAEADYALQLNVKCLSCGEEYEESGTYSCPNCGYPLMQLGCNPETASKLLEKRTGKDKETYDDDPVYMGDFANGTLNGQGKATFANGDFFEGEFDSGFLSHGKAMFSNGNIYEGDFSGWEPFGCGKMIFANGDIYEGEFADGTLNGRGKMTFVDGDIYEGEFADGNFNGCGKMSFADWAVYEGEFADGTLNGRGKMTFANGEVWEGIWIDGKNVGWV